MFNIYNIRYKDILEIDNLSLPPERVTCITGESGSGKTTLLKLLNRLISPDRGEITFGGRPLTEIDPVALRRQAVMLPQVPSVFAGNVRDNLQVGLLFAEKPPATEESMLQVLEQLSLKKGLSDDPEKFSGGERQRLALARVLLADPPVLLLDEPSASLDEGTEHTVISRLVAIAGARAKTLVMVTHSGAIAREFADYLVELNPGRPAGIRRATWTV
jgi:putative ABC transport system ATP-binding protein